jgi:Glycosyltransferase family 87
MPAILSESAKPARDPHRSMDQLSGSSPSRTRASLLLTVLLLLCGGWAVWDTTVGSLTIDFFNAWTVTRAVSSRHVVHIYAPQSQRDIAQLAIDEASLPSASDIQRKAARIVTQLYGGRMDAPGTPFIYCVLGAIPSGNYVADQKRYLLLCTACLVLSVLLLKGVLRFDWVGVLLFLLFAATDFAPVSSDLGVGNVSEIQLLIVVFFIFFAARNQPLLSGLAIGTATMFKPTTGLVLVLAVIAAIADRDYRQLARMLVGSLIGIGTAVLLSAAYFGAPGIWIEFLLSLPRTLNGVSYPLQFGNFSLSALLFGATRTGSSVIPVMLIGAFSWLLFATRQVDGKQASAPENVATRRIHTAFAVGGGGCAIMLLSSPLVWLHYYLLLLPLLLYVLWPLAADGQSLFAERFPLRRTTAFALPLVILFVFSSFTDRLIGINAWLRCVLVVTATLATLALASFYVWQGRLRPQTE